MLGYNYILAFIILGVFVQPHRVGAPNNTIALSWGVFGWFITVGPVKFLNS